MDGKDVIVLTEKSPLKDKKTGKIFGVLGISINISAQKNAEEEAKNALLQAALLKNKAKMEEELSADIKSYSESMAHDFKTPILHLKLLAPFDEEIYEGTLKLCKDAEQKGIEVKKYFKKNTLSNLTEKYVPKSIEKISANLFEIVNSSMDCIRIADKARTQPLDKKDLRVERIDEFIELILENSAIRSEDERKLFHIKADYYFEFFGNVILMIRILTNLIQNTLYQIRKNGKGEVYVTTEDGGEYNILRFKDTAGGASKEVVDLMFKDGFTTKENEGTGVGLGFCKRVMNWFGGDIIAESKDGAMEFILKFPKIKN
jgi:signal transduction histidine kinase